MVGILLNCEAIAFALLVKGVDRVRRPDARAICAIEPETPQEPEVSQEPEKRRHGFDGAAASPQRVREFVIE